jgi:YidC/Oxa1 family membrane protein insertase
MDTKNVIAAISLSAAVIILYSLFFAPPPVTKEQLAEKNKTEQNTDAPSLDQKENVTEITREEALSQSKRIQFENQNIIGSISLKGAAIDDLTLKNTMLPWKVTRKLNFYHQEILKMDTL